MKVLLDNFIFSKTKNGGVSNYWFHICNYMMKHHESEVNFLDSQPSLNYHRTKLEIPVEKILAHYSPKFLAGAVPIVYKSKEKFIYHSSYYRALIGSNNMSEITTVHDFTHDYYFPFMQRKKHNLIKYNAIKRSAGIICISNNTYNDLLKFCPLKPNQKVSVIHHGVSDEYFPLTVKDTNSLYLNFSLHRPYILFIGARGGYKNFNFAVALLKELPGYNLVVVGAPFTNNEKSILGATLLKKTHLFTNIDDAQLNILYNHAHALLYPSDYEGFGMPVIEAMRAGCPVLALNNSSIAEVAGGYGILYNTKSISDFKAGILMLENLDYRKGIIEQAINYSKKYDWGKSMENTYGFYEEVNRNCV